MFLVLWKLYKTEGSSKEGGREKEGGMPST